MIRHIDGKSSAEYNALDSFHINDTGRNNNIGDIVNTSRKFLDASRDKMLVMKKLDEN